jgi:hypothetical protein
MGKIRKMCVVFTCMLATGLAVPAYAVINDNYSSNEQSVVFGSAHTTGSSHQATGTEPIPDELLLIGAAVIGLIGISIMRKTLH